MKILDRLGNTRLWVSLVAIIATLALGAEVYLTLANIWKTLSVGGQFLVMLVTLFVVVIFGWKKR